MLARYAPFLLLLALQVFADESLTELKGKVEDVIKNKGLTCYVCTSYLPQCNGTVDNSQKWVPHMLCKGKCFVRVGEEKATGRTFAEIETKYIHCGLEALYRGCTDGWTKVEKLDLDYVGCRNHTWNGVTRLWCLCDTERCNGASLETLAGLKTSRSHTPHGSKKESLYPINALESRNRDEHIAAIGHFKDYNHAYDDNVAYSDKGQYYDDDAYDDRNYVDTDKYDRHESQHKKKEDSRPINLIYPSPLPYDENTPIQEDREEYVKPREEKRKPKRREEEKEDSPQYGYDDALSYKKPESHHTVEEYKPKKRRSEKPVRTYRSETRTEKYEGRDRGHTEHVREQTYSFRDTQGHDYPLHTQDKMDIDQVHYGENNDVYVKPSEERERQPYLLPDIPKPFWEPMYPDNLVPDAYYPYGHEIPVFNNQEDEAHFYDASTTPTTSTSTTTHPPPTKQPFKPTTDYNVGHGSNTDHPMPGEKVFCAETGFYQHPTDCSAFIACTIDDHVNKPVMNHMRCPKGLFWDNTRRTCDYYSSTCKDPKASEKSRLIELGDYGRDYDRDYENEKLEEVSDKKQNEVKKVYTDLEESHGYDASFESKKAYFTK